MSSEHCDNELALLRMGFRQACEERDALRAQVMALQAGDNSYQSGYDKGRADGTKARLSELEQERRINAELRAKQAVDWFPTIVKDAEQAALEVFSQSCDHTRWAVEYMAAYLLSAAPPPPPPPPAQQSQWVRVTPELRAHAQRLQDEMCADVQEGGAPKFPSWILDVLSATGDTAAPEQPKCSMCRDVGIVGHSEICPACSDSWQPPAERAEQPTGTTSDQYRAELYGEVFKKARRMGYGTVIEALIALERIKSQAEQDAVTVPRDTLQRAADRFSKAQIFDFASELRALLAKEGE